MYERKSFQDENASNGPRWFPTSVPVGKSVGSNRPPGTTGFYPWRNNAMKNRLSKYRPLHPPLHVCGIGARRWTGAAWKPLFPAVMIVFAGVVTVSVGA